MGERLEVLGVFKHFFKFTYFAFLTICLSLIEYFCLLFVVLEQWFLLGGLKDGIRSFVGIRTSKIRWCDYTTIEK